MCKKCAKLSAEIFHTEAVKSRPDGRYQLRKIVRTKNEIFNKIFKKQLDYVLKESAKFWPFKESIQTNASDELESSINKLVDTIPEQEEMSEILDTQRTLLLNRGSRTVIKNLGLVELGTTFDVKNQKAIDWLKAKKKFDLSSALGTIHATTQKKIKRILIDGANEGKAYTELAKEIELLSKHGVFSRARAQLISTRELGLAYEKGNNIPVSDFVDKNPDRDTEKFWQTVNDNRVTVTHRANQGNEWIPFKQNFSGTGDPHAPGSDNPRCRCFTKYRILPPKK